MKLRYNILVLAMAAMAVVACTNEPEVIDFKSDVNTIEADADGGVKKIRIQSSDEWVASVGMQSNGDPNPWITVSPANGRGSVTCDFIIDSALTTQPREAVVSIRNIRTNKEQRISVKQQGYKYSVELDKTNVEVKKFAEYGKRYFDVMVKTNFDFDVKIPREAQKWIERESASKLGDAYKLNLNRGIRPREVKVRFNWKINNSPDVRLADIEFEPVGEGVTVAYSDKLSVLQEAGENIEKVKDTPAGDSLALLNIAQTMQCWTQYDTSVPMNRWSGITLWDERMEGCRPEWVGRVKRVEIFLCNSYEGLPFETKYLTAADEIYIFSNENSMLKSIDLFGNFIEENPLTDEDPLTENRSLRLENLKRLTVGAFGVSKFTYDNDKVYMPNLEFLDLGSNNFQRVPEVITKENFPKLRALVLNAQQRHAVSDLSNTRYAIEQLGGLVEEEKFPERLLKWGLDTLVLSVNYLHGALPSFEDDPEVPKWTEEEVIAADTLPMALVGTPKVMPTTKTFRINHNRLSGEVPTWLLMHPALDWWVPFSLVFPQEGRWSDGTKAGFTNEPASLVDYYKNWYPNKKMANSIEEEIPEDDSNILGK